MKKGASIIVINLKWTAIWIVIQALSLYFLTYLFDFLALQKGVFYLILMGLGVTVIANIIRIYTRKKKFVVNRRFAYWIAVNTFSIWIIWMILDRFSIESEITYFLLSGLSLVIVGKIFQKLGIGRNHPIIVTVLLLGIIFFSNNPSLLAGKIGAVTESIDEKITRFEENAAKSAKTRAEEAFNQINQLRSESGLHTITWDDRAYNLAVDRAKDMEERNYFDHVTPEGTCVKDMKKTYGFSSSDVLAENVWGIWGGSSDPSSAVESWMTSKGHRANLLWIDHKSGAIGCSGGFCVFLGVHNNPYGLGGGDRCTTGAEGLAFWENES